MPGEAMHHKGEDGAQRAKRWLDSTTRTRSSWTNREDVSAARMTFNWPHGTKTEFSFDVGGILYGAPFDNHNFVAEVKFYSSDSDLGAHFDKFLAQCYYVFKEFSRWVNQFMFITWNPFRATSWQKLCDPDSIIKACIANRRRLFDLEDSEDEDEAKGKIDMDVVHELANRMWLIVLSEKQEQLLISDEDRALIKQHRVRERRE
jgi:hypothetical protein